MPLINYMKGPAVARIDLTPASPVKNNIDTPATVQVTVGLTEAMKPGELPLLQLDPESLSLAYCRLSKLDREEILSF